MVQIIHTYHNDFSGGIGDFLRGSIYLYKLCQKHNIQMHIDWKNHKIKKYINSDINDIKYDLDIIFDIEELTMKSKLYQHLPYASRQKEIINHIFDQILTSTQYDTIPISSFYLDIYDDLHIPTIDRIKNYFIPEHTKKYLQKNMTISGSVKSLHKKKLKNKKYGTIHFRLGDKHTLPNINKEFASLPQPIKDNFNLKHFDHDYDYLYYLIQKNIKKNNFEHIVVLSDSNDFKKYVKKKNNTKIIIPHFQSNHSSLSPGLLKFSNYKNTNSDVQLKNIALDIETLINSQKNISYSIYTWGSGFSIWPSKIFNIPLEAYQITPY